MILLLNGQDDKFLLQTTFLLLQHINTTESKL